MSDPTYPFDEVARPVWFECDDPIFSIWAKGSSFLCANSRHYYWVTAAHVLTNAAATTQSVRIFPSDQASITLPFNEKYSLKDNDPHDDFKDILILRVDDDEFRKSCDAPLVGQDIEHGFIAAEDLTPGCELWIVGYAAENNYIDYEDAKIRHTRSVMRAIYQGSSHSDFCHVAKIESAIVLSSFDGLSGGPVFYIQPTCRDDSEISLAVLVGMLVRGTATSNLVHFISAGVIQRMIGLALDSSA